MRERRERRWFWWVGRGAVAIALLAALSLAATVLLAQRALANAADIVIRGDGDTLITGVVVDLWETEPELTAGTLASVLERHGAQGLRYLALLDRQDHHPIVEAGASEAAVPRYLPGEVTRHGRRVRLVALIPPRSETRAALDPAASPIGPTQLQPMFALRDLRKDLDLALDVFHRAHAHVPMTAQVREWIDEAATVDGGLDISAIVRRYTRRPREDALNRSS